MRTTKVERHKIVVVGPPAAGKTTLKRVYFEHANPLRLLETKLEPTTGVEVGSYHQFNSEVGVFDLAGQENRRWFEEEPEIFDRADVVVCVLPVTDDALSLVEFAEKVLEVRAAKCPDSRVFVLLHKVDLVSPIRVVKKHRVLNAALEPLETGAFPVAETHRTSIARPYFFQTFNVFTKIIRAAAQRTVLHESEFTLDRATVALRLLLAMEPGVGYSPAALLPRVGASTREFADALDDLRYLHLVAVEGNPQVLKRHRPRPLVPESDDRQSPIHLSRRPRGASCSLHLTDRGKFFTAGLRAQMGKIDRLRREFKARRSKAVITSARRLFETFSALQANDSIDI
ncbi:MAG: hypothetical protein Kow0069_33690 [Promethearchaeota archaeon]